MRYLLHEGAAINPRRDFAEERSNHGTPLYVAVEHGHFPVVMYLIEQGSYQLLCIVPEMLSHKIVQGRP